MVDYNNILNYFETQAKTGQWDSLYDPKNQDSHSFIARLQKSLDMAGSFQNKSVLDLGCGTGILIPFVLDYGGKYTGLDISRNMLDEIKKNYPDYSNSENVRLICGDINSVKLPENMDIIIGLGFIEYLPNPGEVIKQLYSLLSKGGRLILTFPNLNSLDYLSIRSLAPIRRLARLLTGKATPQPPRKLWTIKSAREYYIQAGFKNLTLVNYNVNILSYPFTKIARNFTSSLSKKLEQSFLSKYNFLSTGFIVSGEKK